MRYCVLYNVYSEHVEEEGEGKGKGDYKGTKKHQHTSWLTETHTHTIGHAVRSRASAKGMVCWAKAVASSAVGHKP